MGHYLNIKFMEDYIVSKFMEQLTIIYPNNKDIKNIVKKDNNEYEKMILLLITNKNKYRIKYV